MCRVGERDAGVKRAEASFGHCIHLESALLMKIWRVIYCEIALL